MKLKRSIICVLLISLIMSHAFALSAYAGSGPTDKAAEVCRDIGVLRGGDGGVDKKYLSEKTTRLQAMHITTRLIGKESVALSYVWTENFGDVSLVTYESGRNLLAYIRSHPDLGWQGDLNGMIDPLGYISSQAMYKVLLSVLGYKLGEDFAWEETLAFAGGKGLKALAQKRGHLTNGDVSVMLVETLKTRMKGNEDTLCEFLVGKGVIDEDAACAASMLPGSPGFAPLLTYKNGGPLLVSVELREEQKKIIIKFNTELNPTYAKALKNYSYFMPGTGYIALPGKCMTSMADEYTVVIQFPGEGWLAYSDKIETDAFLSYIASERKNEIRASGLLDVDGNQLRDVYIDIPPAPGSASKNDGSYNSGGGSQFRPSDIYRRISGTLP